MGISWVWTREGEQHLLENVQGVWEHSCECQFFYLNDDGTVTCAGCGEALASLRWERQREQ